VRYFPYYHTGTDGSVIVPFHFLVQH